MPISRSAANTAATQAYSVRWPGRGLEIVGSGVRGGMGTGPTGAATGILP